jgi:ribokinase
VAEVKAQIVVVGSHAPGLFIRVSRIPVAGETVTGWDFQEPMDGGKGSHQAIVAAKLGIKTSFVGCVGKDRFGKAAKAWMTSAGVQLSHLYFSETKNTGLGFIMLDETGVPAMVSSMGANEELDDYRVEKALGDLRDAKVMLTQFEIRASVAIHALRVARQYGMTAILNPAPAKDVRLQDLSAAHILIPNESEAKVLLGYLPHEEIEPSSMVTELLHRSGAVCVIITLGEAGILGEDAVGKWQYTAPKLDVVDTSGAGDVFCGALAVGIVRGWTYQTASIWACQVASLSVTKAGTIPSFPTAEEVDSFLETMS